jgi:hypothetical protein
MRLVLLLVLVPVMAACSGSTPPQPDGGDICTGQNYDPCDSEHNCQSGNCRPFTDENITVCTLACDESTPCPNTTAGKAVTCNASQLCEPPVANSCHIAGT